MSSARIIGIDVARTLALLGMFAAHIGGRYTDSGDVTLLFQTVAGRSSALFAVLAGVSLVLLTQRRLREQPDSVGSVRTQLAVRAFNIALIGIFIGTLNSGVAVILVNYGLLFLLAIPVITWGWRRLIALAALWLVLTPTLTWLIRPALPAPSGRVTSLLSITHPVESLSELFVTGYYPVLTWGTYLFFGMALARLDLRRSVLAWRLFVVGTVTAVATLAISALYTNSSAVQQILSRNVGFDPAQWDTVERRLTLGWSGDAALSSWAWMPVWAPHTGTMMDVLHTCATAAAVLGGALLVTSAVPTRFARAWQIFWGAGTMTLTLYTAHVIVLAGPAWIPGDHSLIAHSIGSLLVGMVFVAKGWRGPLEVLINPSRPAGRSDTNPRPV